MSSSKATLDRLLSTSLPGMSAGCLLVRVKDFRVNEGEGSMYLDFLFPPPVLVLPPPEDFNPALLAVFIIVRLAKPL